MIKLTVTFDQSTDEQVFILRIPAFDLVDTVAGLDSFEKAEVEDCLKPMTHIHEKLLALEIIARRRWEQNPQPVHEIPEPVPSPAPAASSDHRAENICRLLIEMQSLGISLNAGHPTTTPLSLMQEIWEDARREAREIDGGHALQTTPLGRTLVMLFVMLRLASRHGEANLVRRIESEIASIREQVAQRGQVTQQERHRRLNEQSRERVLIDLGDEGSEISSREIDGLAHMLNDIRSAVLNDDVVRARRLQQLYDRSIRDYRARVRQARQDALVATLREQQANAVRTLEALNDARNQAARQVIQDQARGTTSPAPDPRIPPSPARRDP